MPNHQDLIEILLKNRGIKKENWDKFLNPSYDNDIYDPFLMKDMDLACDRIFEAIKANEKIVIYSDYDCDGIPAGVMMYDFFKKIGFENFTNYIPDRLDEGYGLHIEAIEQFIRDKVKLIITFDLGITAVEEVALAKSNNVDVIVTDHHIPQDEVPKAYAIINPKQKECGYPDKMLCGAGIAFKLVSALVSKYGEELKINKGWEKWLLDMAGVATLSDQVPLLDENRVLAYYGLKVLKKGRRLGLVEIFSMNNIKISDIHEEDITFTLAPRINAASRMGDPMDAFNLLSTHDVKEAKALAFSLSKINDNRKQMVAHIMKEVKGSLSKRGYLEDDSKPIIVIGNPKWKVGILGIIASKIVDEYKKTVLVWGSDDNGIIKGSGRSYGNINLVEMLSLLPEGSLVDFGGHQCACGFTVSQEEIHFLEERIDVAYEKLSIESSEEKSFNIDATISLDDVTEDNYKVIEKLAPYGVGNPKPSFLFKNIIISSLKEFGKDMNHLELVFKNSRGKIIKAIAFFKTRESYKAVLARDSVIDLIASFEKNTFGGKSEIRLRIIDIVIK